MKKKKKKKKKKIEVNFDLSPRGIRELLGLNKPIYEATAAYGHFGRKPTNNGEFSWEKTDKTDVFKMWPWKSLKFSLNRVIKLCVYKMGFSPFFFGAN